MRRSTARPASPFSLRMLAFAGLAISCVATTSALRAEPIQDARALLSDFGLRARFPGVSANNSPGNVFQAINSGHLTSIDLYVFEKSPEAPILSVELWSALEGEPFRPREPNGGLLERLATSAPLPAESIPWAEGSFIFEEPAQVAAGEWYGFRVVAAETEGWSRLWGSEPPDETLPAFKAWVEPEPDPTPGELFSRLTMGADNEVRGAAFVAVEGEPVEADVQWDLRQVFSREFDGQTLEYEAKLGSLDFDPPLGPAGKTALGDGTNNPGLGIYVGPGQTATFRLHASDAALGLSSMTEATFTGYPLGPLGIPGDVDGSGRVDLGDFAIVKENFGQVAAAAVPEPSGLALVGAGAAALALLGVSRSRRRR